MKILLQYMTADNYDELRRVFATFDTDNTGYITIENFRTGLKRLGLKLAARQINQMIKSADYMKRGAINYSEFLMATIDVKEQLSD
jgi:Ca2+-binding EF-hand superfamily protein